MKAMVCEGPPYPDDVLVLVPHKNLITGSKEIAKAIGELTSLEEDLLTLAAAIFGVDLAAKRGEREKLTRNLMLSIPVVNHHAFTHLRDDLAYILYLLSDDNWTIDFVQREGTPEGARHWSVQDGQTLLFSGGLDSLAAAVEVLERGSTLQLASHYTRNRATKTSQDQLFQHLSSTFGGRVSRVTARITGQNSGALRFPSDDEREATQRTRSFAFLVLGAIVARRTGFRDVLFIAENGQMAIHLPLTAARIGAFSTHTAHPEFVHEMERFLGAVLSFPLSIRNPFLYRTKAECIAPLFADHWAAVEQSVSCWRSSRQASRHCGECVPCLIRRIAIEVHGQYLAEYARDLLAERVADLPADDLGKRNLVELAEFVAWFGGSHSDARLEETFPDLYNEHIDRTQAIQMYRRFAIEAQTVFARYPGVGSIYL